MITLFSIVIPAWIARFQVPWIDFELTIPGTGYPLPGGYDELFL
jgi:hypothetical protein